MILFERITSLVLLKIGTLKRTCVYCECDLKFEQLAFLTACDQAFNPPFLGGKIIELAKFCFKNKRFEPSLSFFSKQVIVSHCV